MTSVIAKHVANAGEISKAFVNALADQAPADRALIEGELGMLLGDDSVEVSFHDEALFASALVRRAGRLQGSQKPVTLDTLLGPPGKPNPANIVRKRLTRILSTWVQRGRPANYKLVFLLPETHPMRPVIEQVVNEGIPRIFEQEFVGDDASRVVPKFTFKWIGLNVGQRQVHNALVYSKAQARGEAVKAAKKPKTA